MPFSRMCVLILGTLHSAALGANILVMFPLPFNSHLRAIQPLLKELTTRGHQVTVYSTSPLVSPTPNYNDVVVQNIFPMEFRNILKEYRKSSALQMTFYFWYMGIEGCEKVFQQSTLKQLIHSTNQSYDLIILETFFLGEPFIALGHKFNAPIINFHPIAANSYVDHLTGNAYATDHIPNYRLPFGCHMSFLERVKNFLIEVFETAGYRLYYLPEQERIMHKYFTYPGAETMAPLLQQIHETSFTLFDIDLSQSYSRPHLPNYAAIGGMHIPSKNSLPQDLQIFMDQAPNGVIYFSFGSMFPISGLEPEKIKTLLLVFSQLPQRVIMKWEEATLPEQPDNVKIGKWLPQLEILAHPKCKLFITHGGYHSILEAAYYGVPVLGIPIFADQPINVIRAEISGFGLKFNVDNFTDETFSLAINTILKNASFKESAMRQASLVRDRLVSPLQEAVFWVEFVIRHKGASHLRSAATYLSWYQHLLLDVIAFIIVLSATTLLLSYCTIKYIILLFLAKKYPTGSARAMRRKTD